MWDRERSDKQLSEPKIDGCHASIRAEPLALLCALPQIPASPRPLLRRSPPPPAVGPGRLCLSIGAAEGFSRAASLSRQHPAAFASSKRHAAAGARATD